MCDCRPERAKALPKHHSFVLSGLSGRIYPFPTTQGVALGYELVALSGRFNRTGRKDLKDLNRFVRFDFRFARRPLVLAKRLKKSSLIQGDFLCYLLHLLPRGFLSVQVVILELVFYRGSTKKSSAHS